MFSSERKILGGVPRGSVLSPTLYAIYISDLKLLKYHTSALYADDTALISTGKVSNAIVKKLENAILHTKKLFLKWKIKINDYKTQAIFFPFNNHQTEYLVDDML